jgi:hypothetical protein
MIASNSQMETLIHFFQTFKRANPNTNPQRFMSDRNVGQITALSTTWASATILLCWWHVLHAWCQHICIDSFPEVWELLKLWIQVDSPESFDLMWSKLVEKAPALFIQYLKQYWLPGAYIQVYNILY